MTKINQAGMKAIIDDKWIKFYKRPIEKFPVEIVNYIEFYILLCYSSLKWKIWLLYLTARIISDFINNISRYTSL